MNLIRITSLASVGFAVLVEPAFAGQPVPGPIAGIGLPALEARGRGLALIIDEAYRAALEQ